MNIDDVLARIRDAAGDPAKLTLATLDAVLVSADQADLRPVLEAAAIPHWFDQRVLACLGDGDAPPPGVMEKIVALPMVEPFPSRGAHNVHQATRIALRDNVCASDPARFRRLSGQASTCFAGDDPHLAIEALYHKLTAEPAAGADALRDLCNKWDSAGQYEWLQALGIMLDELMRSRWLAPVARMRVTLWFCTIKGASLPLLQVEELVQEALHLAQEQDSQLDVRDAYNLLGQAMEQRGQYTGALEFYRKQLDISRAEYGRNPSDMRSARELSNGTHFVAQALESLGRLREALSFYRVSRDILEGLMAREPANTDWPRDLAVVRNSIGRIMETKRWLRGALSEFEAATALNNELVSRDGTNPDWLRLLSSSHQRLGNIAEAQDRLDDALGEYRKARRIAQVLTGRDPGNLGWQSNLMVAHNRVGLVHQARNELDAAQAEYVAAKQIMENLVVRDPDNLDWRRQLAIAHCCMGSVLWEKQATDPTLKAEARAEYEAAERILIPLAAAAPEHNALQADLATTRNWLVIIRAA